MAGVRRVRAVGRGAAAVGAAGGENRIGRSRGAVPVGAAPLGLGACVRWCVRQLGEAPNWRMRPASRLLFWGAKVRGRWGLAEGCFLQYVDTVGDGDFRSRRSPAVHRRRNARSPHPSQVGAYHAANGAFTRNARLLQSPTAAHRASSTGAIPKPSAVNDSCGWPPPSRPERASGPTVQTIRTARFPTIGNRLSGAIVKSCGWAA